MTSTQAWRVVSIVAVVVLVATGVVLLRDSSDPRAGAGPPRTRPSGTSTGTPSTPPRPGCASTARSFTPARVDVPGVGRGIDVVTPPRDAAGVPGVPPLTSSGKSVFAYDREQGVRPGDRRGNVLLNAHTWPDGSALGNRLLTQLRRGDRLVLRGQGRSLCYRVTERVEVLAADGLPRFYDTRGRPQVAIVVCSGRRLGPGVWERRTIWFASPHA
jgi:hypothetical protein